MSGAQSTALSLRDQHLFGPGPKRILSLDGGGVRGAISIAFLERLEKVVEEIEGRPTLLADWFDLIGGTSTGAIIASALACGFRAKDIHKLYTNIGHRVFRRSRWRIAGLVAKFASKTLIAEIENAIGRRSLESDEIRTGLGIVAKRLDTGSAWFIANNPKSAYWNDPPDKSYIGNRHYRLSTLIRASAAAPTFFDPEVIQIHDKEPPGIFIDGGLTPHNNPALQLFLFATLPQYGLNWAMGPENLTIVSVGTGYSRPTVGLKELRWIRPIGMALRALAAQVSESQQLVLTLMSWFGETPITWPINAELGDMGQICPPFKQSLFRFLRYDIRLERDWLHRELGVESDERTVMKYRRIDAPENIPAIYDLGARAAELQVKRSHFV